MKEAEEPLREGSLRHLRVSPLRIPWVAYHDEFIPNRQFRDTQLRGPFLSWIHRHRFEPDGSRCTWLLDEIQFRAPIPTIFLRAQLRSMFLYRHLATLHDLQLAGRFLRPLTVAMTGSGGLLGRALRSLLLVCGCRVIRLVRGAARKPDELCWQGPLRDLHSLRCDALIHLAGAPLNRGNFGERHRRAVRDSRIAGTRELVEQLLRLPEPPSTVISASGINFYGETAAPVSEAAPRGSGFLAELCEGWEAALEPLEAAGIRVVPLRLGPVLSRRSGLLPPFYWCTRFAFAPTFGSGQQGVSWVSREDVEALVVECLVDSRWRGPHNVVAPQPCTQQQFASELARLLWRPVLRLPVSVSALLLGKRSELVLQGTLAAPARALEHGFSFSQPELPRALRMATGFYSADDEPDSFTFQLS